MQKLLILKLFRLIWVISPFGYHLWIIGLTLFIFWAERICILKEEKLLGFPETSFIIAIILFLIAIKSKLLHRKVFLISSEVSLKTKRFIGSFLVILFISYKVYNEIMIEKFKYIKETNYSSELELINKKIHTSGEIVFPYIGFKKLREIVSKINGMNIFPVSQPSYSYIMYCHDGEKWVYYKTDRFGLRNNDKVWDESGIFLINQDISKCSNMSFAEELQSKIGISVIDLTSRGENIIISLMKIVEFVPKDRLRLALIILSKESFLNTKEFWDKNILERYIKEEGQNIKDLKTQIDDAIKQYLIDKINRKDILSPIFKVYENLYSPWVLAEFLKTAFPKKQNISKIDIEIGKFILGRIIKFLGKEKSIFLFIGEERDNDRMKEIKDFLKSNGAKIKEIKDIKELVNEINSIISGDTK